MKKAKYIAASVLAFALAVNAALPAAGGFFNDTAVVASADEEVKPTIGARSATDDKGNVYLGGNYIEVGIAKIGSFGTTEDAPAGFHPKSGKRLGLVCDKDGFDVGNPPTTGDFFIPGSPEERFLLAYKRGEEMYNNSNCALTTSYGWDDPVQPIETVDESDVAAGKLRAVTTGITNDNIKVEQVVEFTTDDKYFNITVTVTNLSEESIDSVRYVRAIDPDQDVDTQHTHNTYNKVICNPNEHVPYTKDQCAFVVARGEKTLDGFFFFSFDPHARASTGKWVTRSAYEYEYLWENNDDLPTTIDETAMDLTQEMIDSEEYKTVVDGVTLINGFNCKDDEVAMTFDWGTLEPGQSVTGSFVESLDPSVQASMANLTAEVEADISKEYNAEEQAVDPEEVKVTCAGFDLVNGTDYELVGTTSATDAGDYSFNVHFIGQYASADDIEVTWEITKAPLTVTANDVTINVGEEPSAAGAVFEGFKGEDDESVLGGELVLDFSAYTKESGAGDYPIVPFGLTSDNYAITFKNGTLHVVDDTSSDDTSSEDTSSQDSSSSSSSSSSSNSSNGGSKDSSAPADSNPATGAAAGVSLALVAMGAVVVAKKRK